MRMPFSRKHSELPATTTQKTEYPEFIMNFGLTPRREPYMTVLTVNIHTLMTEDSTDSLPRRQQAPAASGYTTTTTDAV